MTNLPNEEIKQSITNLKQELVSFKEKQERNVDELISHLKGLKRYYKNRYEKSKLMVNLMKTLLHKHIELKYYSTSSVVSIINEDIDAIESGSDVDLQIIVDQLKEIVVEIEDTILDSLNIKDEMFLLIDAIKPDEMGSLSSQTFYFLPLLKYAIGTSQEQSELHLRFILELIFHIVNDAVKCI